MFWSLPASVPRVLVVDDDEDTVTSTALLLRKCGFDVQTADNGDSALRCAAQDCFDLVLLDLALPELDGYSVARALKPDTESTYPLLVAVSGYGRREDVLRCAEAGFDLHLTKPVDPIVLTRLPLLFERAESALQATQRLVAEQRALMTTLLQEQLRLVQACVDLAMFNERPESKKALLLRAARLCARVADRVASAGSGQASLIPRIIALQQAIADITYRTIEPR